MENFQMLIQLLKFFESLTCCNLFFALNSAYHVEIDYIFPENDKYCRIKFFFVSMPKGWIPQVRASRQMPSLSVLASPMVGLNSLSIKGYKVNRIEMIEEGTGNPHPTKNHTWLEVHPIELDYSLVITNGISKGGTGYPLTQISNVRLASITKGRFTKRESLILEMNYLGLDSKKYILRIDIEDKHSDEILRQIESSQQTETDSNYWAHRSLTSIDQFGQTVTVDIYPLTPYLAVGEEILWQSLKADVNDKNKKVIRIDVVTNFRVFQYSYQEHKGSVILFPSVEDVKVNNEIRGVGFGEYNTTSSYLSGIQFSGVTGIVGEVVIYSQGSSWMTFAQVNDPETLTNVVRTLNQMQANVLIGNGEATPKPQSKPRFNNQAKRKK